MFLDAEVDREGWGQVSGRAASLPRCAARRSSARGRCTASRPGLTAAARCGRSRSQGPARWAWSRRPRGPGRGCGRAGRPAIARTGPDGAGATGLTCKPSARLPPMSIMRDRRTGRPPGERPAGSSYLSASGPAPSPHTPGALVWCLLICPASAGEPGSLSSAAWELRCPR